MEAKVDDNLDVDVEKMKRVLEDANLYEPNMPMNLMKSYYEALKNSENTASEEDQTRRFNQSQEDLEKLLDETAENVEDVPSQSKEKPFIPKAWSSSKNTSLKESFERNNNENVIERDILEEITSDLPKDATKTAFGFNEMGEDCLKETLTILTHQLKFIPIHSDNKFLNAGTTLKAKMLYAYHTKIIKMKAELARLSFYPAPLPKITSTTEMFPSFSENNTPETYVCRSGRQTKRKIYNYDEDDEDDNLAGTSTKKVKNSEEEEWFSKPAQKHPVRSRQKQEPNKVTAELNNRTELEIVDNSKEKKSRTPLLKKLSNTDIMKRCRLFNDSPKRTCEIMFDKLKDEEEKKAREEKNMELFKKTLQALDEENGDIVDDDDVITLDDEESVTIRKVPQIPRKSMVKKRTNPEGLSPLPISRNQRKKSTEDQLANSKDDKDEPASRPYLKKRPPIRKSTDSPNSVPSSSKISKTVETKIACPICDRYFEENKIMEHASTCGDEPSSPSTRSSSKSKITCEICDKVVDFDTSYEVHVKDCIAKKKERG